MAFVVGIDEAGRGPLAGPVAIGVVKVSEGLKKSFFGGIRDSKKLTSEERELWFRLALEARKEGLLDFRVALVSEKVIDRRGITYAINLGIRRGLTHLSVGEDARIFLDGGIRAPERFRHQITVIRGDEKIPIVSLASIVAKVTRDRRMGRLAKRFPEFNFEKNKGYGTRDHRRSIMKYGPSRIHRRSFINH